MKVGLCASPLTRLRMGYGHVGRSDGEIRKKCSAFGGRDLQGEAGVAQQRFVSRVEVKTEG